MYLEREKLFAASNNSIKYFKTFHLLLPARTYYNAQQENNNVLSPLPLIADSLWAKE